MMKEWAVDMIIRYCEEILEHLRNKRLDNAESLITDLLAALRDRKEDRARQGVVSGI